MREARGQHCLPQLPQLFPFLFWKTGSLNLDLLTGSPKLYDQRASSKALLSLPPQVWGYRCMSVHQAFYVRSGDLNSGPHAYASKYFSSWAPLLSPQPQWRYLLMCSCTGFSELYFFWLVGFLLSKCLIHYSYLGSSG